MPQETSKNIDSTIVYTSKKITKNSNYNNRILSSGILYRRENKLRYKQYGKIIRNHVV